MAPETEGFHVNTYIDVEEALKDLKKILMMGKLS
jgi:hypothetical protein